MLWGTRETLVVTGEDTGERPECDPNYMPWYRSVTRCQILNPKLAQQTTGEFEGTHGVTTYLVENLARVYHTLVEGYRCVNVDDNAFLHITEGMKICTRTLTNVGHAHLLDNPPTDPVAQFREPHTHGRDSRHMDTSSTPVYTQHQFRGNEDVPSASQARDIPSTSRTLHDDVETNDMDYDPSQFCTPHHLVYTQPFPSPLSSRGEVPSSYQVFPSMPQFLSFQSPAPIHDESTLPTPPPTHIQEPRRGPPREARDRGRPCGTHNRVHR